MSMQEQVSLDGAAYKRQVEGVLSATKDTANRQVSALCLNPKP